MIRPFIKQESAELIISVLANKAATITLSTNRADSSMFIDWGDGSVDNYSDNLLQTVAHSYLSVGYDTFYTIRVNSALRTLSFFGDNSSADNINYTLVAVDVSKLSSIETLYLQSRYNSTCKLTYLDVTNNVNLTNLQCYSNQLTALDVTNNVNLTYLQCNNNQLTALDVTNNVNLTYLQCGTNQLTALDVTNNVNLTNLQCYANQLTALDVTNNVNLTYLLCYANQLTDIVGLDGNTNTWKKLMLGNLPLTGNYDLRGINLLDSLSHIIISTTGTIKVNNYMNRNWIYSNKLVNTSPNAFWIDAASYEIYFEGEETPITSKAAYYSRIANMVVADNLYQYPQLCKIVSPAFSIYDTRDNYDTIKILLHDSYLATSWQNENPSVGSVTPYSHIPWMPSFQVDTGSNKGGTYSLSVTYQSDAVFFIAPFFVGYYSWDNHQRLIYDGTTVITDNLQSVSTVDNGDGSRTTTFDITLTSATSYNWYIYLFENKYVSEENPYVNKVTSFIKL